VERKPVKKKKRECQVRLQNSRLKSVRAAARQGEFKKKGAGELLLGKI